jgi:hypothetical protein
MMPPSLECARAMRDGGIHAMAAMNAAVAAAVAGLDSAQARAVRMAFGTPMSEVIDQLINPAIRAFPELNPSDATWNAVAIGQAQAMILRAALPSVGSLQASNDRS